MRRLGWFFTLLLILALPACAPMAAPAPPSPTRQATAEGETELNPLVLPTATPASQATPIASRPTQPSSPQPTPTVAAAVLPERRRLNLDWPTQLRVGDGDWVTLTIEVDEQGNLTPTVSAEGHTVTGEVIEIPSLYETHFVQAEARLDVAGLQVAPQGTVIEPLQPGKRTTFRWSVRATEAGVYRGTVSLHLRFVPKAGGAEQRMAISVLSITMDARTLIGLNGQLARLLGWIGSLIGSVLSLGDVIPFILKLLRRREG